jgi:hypothetical protein
MSDFDIIGKISDVRASNNRLWMKLLEIALRSDPDRAKAVLREINANDARVSALLARLTK